MCKNLHKRVERAIAFLEVANEVFVLTAQRQQLIQNELDHAGRVVSGDLAKRFGLSEDTIRRDLRQMAANGLCRRVYGGAVAPSAGPLDQRHDHLREEKERLARAAAQLISPKQTLIIDAGSTNSAIARLLPENFDLTVMTNAPDIASLLAARRDLRLEILGGTYDSQIGACLGPQTLAALQNVRADWLFLGSCGLDAEIGVTAFDHGEAVVKAAMAKVSNKIVAAVTGEKMGTAAPYRVLPTDGVDVLVALDRAALRPFDDLGVSVKRVADE